MVNPLLKRISHRIGTGLSLHWVLIVPFVVQVVGAVGIVSYLSYQSGKQAVETLASQLLTEVAGRVNESLKTYLEAPEKAVANNRIAFERGTLKLKDLEQVQESCWQQMLVYSLLLSCQFYGDDGTIVGYSRIASKEGERIVAKIAGITLPVGSLFFSSGSPNSIGVRRFYQVDGKGKLQKMIFQLNAGDFRQLPWYQQSKQAKQQSWLPISINPIIPFIQLLAVAPAYNTTGELQGVLLSSQLLFELSGFLNKLHFSPKGQVFIVEHSGKVVATSTLETLVVKSASGKPEPLSAIQSQDIWTREIAKQLIQKFGSFQNLKDIQKLNFPIGGQRLFIQVAPYQERKGLDWLIVTIVPESDFMGEIDKNLQRTLLLCMLTLGVAAITGLLTTYCIAKPIQRLSLASQALAEGNWKPTFEEEDNRSKFAILPISELSILHQSFSRTTEQLQDSFQRIKTALQESEEKFTKIFRSCPDPIAIASLEENQPYLEVNESFVQFTGYSREELIGRTPRELNLYIDWQNRKNILEQLESQGVVRGFEYHYRTKAGNVAIALLSLERVELEGRSWILIVAKDISDRKQMEQQLQEANEDLERRVFIRTQELSVTNVQLQQQIAENQQAQERLTFQFNILSQVNDAVIATDREQRITYWNQAAENLYGFTAEEALGQPLQQIYQEGWLNSEDEQIATRSLQEKGFWQGENIQIKANGESLYVESSVRLIKNEQGVEIGVLAAIRDIRDRKQVELALQTSEAKLRDVLDSAKAGIMGYRFTTPQIFKYEYCSRGCEIIFGYTQEELLTEPKLWMSRVHPEDVNALTTALETLLTCSKTFPKDPHSSTCDYRFYHKDNSLRWISATYTAHWNEAIAGWMVTSVNLDLTEKKQLEAQFYRAQRLESLGTLASGIAHDLNNVFTPILMIIQLLTSRKTEVSEADLELLKILEQSARRGSELVRQTLAFARGTEGQQTAVQIDYLLLEITKVIKQTFPKSIQIQTDIPVEALGLVYADPTQLHQVFMNLVVNARDAMPEGGTLTISAANRFIDATYAQMNLDAREGNYLAIAVADTGMGIPTAIMECIFDPFFTTKETGKGTGLGLSTVLTIVKKHRGFLQLASEVGKGTTFQVFLPVIEGTEVQVEAEEIFPSGNGELVLVVDDEVAVQQVVEKLLTAYQYRTLVANDGIEGITLYAKHKAEITLLLIDSMMPNMDGVITIRALRKMNPDIKIIAASGLPINQQEVLSAGANLFLQKPYTSEDLLKALRDLRLQTLDP